jgi:hypothetical protein
MVGCVNKLTSKKTGESVPDYILVDGNRLPDGFSEKKAQCVVKVLHKLPIVDKSFAASVHLLNLAISSGMMQ